MIYADFEPILASENNGKQNPDDLIQTNTKNMLFAAMAINQSVLIISFMLFKLYLGEDTVYNFINSIIEESKYCNNIMEKHCDD